MNEKMSKKQIITSTLIVLCAFLLVFLAVVPVVSANAEQINDILTSGATVQITIKGMIERAYGTNEWDSSYTKTVSVDATAPVSFKTIYNTFVYNDFILGQSSYMYETLVDDVHGRVGQFTVSGNDARNWSEGETLTIFHEKSPKIYVVTPDLVQREHYYRIGDEIHNYLTSYKNHSFGDQVYFAGVVRANTSITYDNLVPNSYALQESDNDTAFTTAYLAKSYIKFRVQVRSDWVGGENDDLGYVDSKGYELNTGNTATLSSYLSDIETFTKMHQSLSACNFSHFEIDGAVATTYTMPTTGTTKEIVAVYKYVPYIYLHYPEVTKKTTYNTDTNTLDLSAIGTMFLPERPDSYFAGWSFVENGTYADLITNKILQVEHAGKHVYAIYLTYTKMSLKVNITDPVSGDVYTKEVSAQDGKYEYTHTDYLSTRSYDTYYIVKNNDEFYYQQGIKFYSADCMRIFRTYLDSHRSLGGNYMIKTIKANNGDREIGIYYSSSSPDSFLTDSKDVALTMNITLKDYIVIVTPDTSDSTKYHENPIYFADTNARIDLSTVTPSTYPNIPVSITRTNSNGKDVVLPFLGISNRKDGAQIDVDNTYNIVASVDKGRVFYSTYNDPNAIPVRLYVDSTLSDLATVYTPDVKIGEYTELDPKYTLGTTIDFPNDAYNTSLDMTIEQAFNIEREHWYGYDSDGDGKIDPIYKSRYDYIYEKLSELYMKAFYPDDEIGTDNWTTHYPVKDRFRLTFYNYDFTQKTPPSTKLDNLSDKVINIVVTQQDGYTVKFVMILPDTKQIVGKVLDQAYEVYTYFAQPGTTIQYPDIDYTTKRVSIYINGQFYYCDFQIWTLDKCTWKHWLDDKSIYESECTTSTHPAVPTNYVINNDTVVYASCICADTSVIPGVGENGGNEIVDKPICSCGWCKILDKLGWEATSFRKFIHLKDWSLSNIFKTFGKEPWFIITCIVIGLILLAIFFPIISLLFNLIMLPFRGVAKMTKKANNKIKKAGKKK